MELPLMVLLSFGVGVATLACQPKCHCEDLRATCENQSLEYIPHMLNPLVEELRLSHNALPSLQNALDIYRGLLVLDLSFNQIKDLYIGHSGQEYTLQHFNLSSNLIRNLDNRTFHGMIHLESLTLSHNHLEVIPEGIFKDLVELSTLDLSSNQIRTIHSLAFVGLANLRVLWLQQNQLTEVPSASFSHTLNIQFLDLSFNPLSFLQENSFSSLVNLQDLYLNNCDIRNLSKSAFRLLRSLMVLRLDNNDLQEVPTRPLQEINKLHDLYLGQNSFKVLRPASFKKLRYLHLIEITNAPYLDRIEKDAFIDNPNLIEINISYNKNLKYLHKDSFNGLRYLKRLSLMHNSIETLPASLINWSSLDFMDFRGNPLECNCSLVWVTSDIVLSNRSQHLLGETRCAKPPRVRNVRLTELQLNCGVMTRDVLIISLTLASGFALLLAALALWLLRKRLANCLPKKEPDYHKSDVEEEFILQAAKQYSLKLAPVTEL